jgi:dinuclear metal center YbgI/SA1388 family protein
MAIILRELIQYLESAAPLSYQESYDNSGLQLGNPETLIRAALLTIDTTEEVIDEAIKNGCNLIISHHPVIFSGLKKITGRSYTERIVLKAIKNDIALYAAHTNFDSVMQGVNAKICENIGLKDYKILQPSNGQLKKLVTFVPRDHAEKVRNALFEAGAGQIGNYDSCSFNSEGLGSFRGGENTQPYAGTKGILHFEKEVRIETIFPGFIQGQIINALLSAHPYEEVAYDLYLLDNSFAQVGMGMIGTLDSPEVEEDFLKNLKKNFKIKVIRHTRLKGSLIKKVAVCGGSGSFLLQNAITAGADIFITGDFKYHQFFDADGKIVVADIGHYESEQFTKELFYELLIKKFHTFAVHLSEVNTNPVYYF